jgi:AraC-like DNA-binding protein
MWDPKPGRERPGRALSHDGGASSDVAASPFDAPVALHATLRAVLPYDPMPTPGLSSPVRWAIDHVAQNYARRLPLRELAAGSGRTPFQLIRAFRREVGITPHVFLLRVRVLCGTAMLLRGEPLAGVASAVGFVDQGHFGRHFKRVHGRTPTQFLAASGRRRVRRAGAADDRYGAGSS